VDASCSVESDCSVHSEQRSGLSNETVWAAGNGNRAAQQLLYDSCAESTWALILRIVGRRDAEDVCQQVFLHVFSSLNQFAGESRFETWLYRVVTNECFQHLRRQRQKQESWLNLIEPVDPTPSHENSCDNIELLNIALTRLDPELRALFLLREKELLSYRELAEILEISDGTVASRLNRARTLLQEYLCELGWNG
jgi:RNA polymerase sigma-70 factor (ECF subfamily)